MLKTVATSSILLFVMVLPLKAAMQITNLEIAEGRDFTLSGDWLAYLSDQSNLIVINLRTHASSTVSTGDISTYTISADWLVLLDSSGFIHCRNLNTGDVREISDARFGFLVANNWIATECSVLNLDTGEEREYVDITGLESCGLAHNVWLFDKWLVVGRHGRDTWVHNLETGQNTSLGIASDIPCYGGAACDTTKLHRTYGSWIVFRSDTIVHVHNLATGETRNTGLCTASETVSSEDISVCTSCERFLRIVVSEVGLPELGCEPLDHNADGDTEDVVQYIHNLFTGQTELLETEATTSSCIVNDAWCVFYMSEIVQDSDLNGDGDIDDTVVHVRNVTTGTSTNTSLAGRAESISGDYVALQVSEQAQAEDLNADGDMADWVWHIIDLDFSTTDALFRRGYANPDDLCDLSDAVFILGYLFLGTGTPTCLDTADVDDNNRLEITDAVYLLSHLYLGGPAPAEPFGECGIDESADDLTCESFPACQ